MDNHLPSEFQLGIGAMRFRRLISQYFKFSNNTNLDELDKELSGDIYLRWKEGVDDLLKSDHTSDIGNNERVDYARLCIESPCCINIVVPRFYREKGPKSI